MTDLDHAGGRSMGVSPEQRKQLVEGLVKGLRCEIPFSSCLISAYTGQVAGARSSAAQAAMAAPGLLTVTMDKKVIMPAKVGGIGCLLNLGHDTAANVQGMKTLDADTSQRWLLVATPAQAGSSSECGEFCMSSGEDEEQPAHPLRVARAGMELLWDYAATTTDADDELAHTQCMCPRCKHVQEWVPPREWLKGGAEWEPRMVVQLQRKAAPRRAA